MSLSSKLFHFLIAEFSDITGIPYDKVYEIVDTLSSKGFTVVLPSKPMKVWALR